MHVVFVSHYALPHLGGIETAVDGLARELVARGHGVTLVASGALRGDEPAGAVERPYEVQLVPAWNGAEQRAGVPYPVFSPRVVPVLRRAVATADVVHCHGYLYLGTHAGLAAAHRSPSRPLRVVTEHVAQVPYDSPVLAGAQRLAAATLGRTALRGAEGAVVLNAKVDAEVARLAPDLPRRRIVNGVDAERFRPAAPGEREALRAHLGWGDEPRALFVGRLVEKKGVDVVVDAAARLPDVRFALVGPGVPPGTVPPNVELMGARTPELVAELYRAADAFVLPSRGEGFPVTAQEAMASGLPVLLGEDPSYAPMLAGAGTAVRLVETTGEAVAAKLQAVLKDPARRTAAAAQAVEHARRAFSWSRAADEHEAFYGELHERRASDGR